MNLQTYTPPLVAILGVARYAAVEIVSKTSRRFTVAAEFFEREPLPRDVIMAGDELVVVAACTWDKYKRVATIEGELTDG